MVAGLFFCSVFSAKAQYTSYRAPMQDTKGSSGLNFYLGGNTFLGDLGGNQGKGRPYAKDFNSKTVRPFVGVSYAYFPYSWLSIKAGLHFTAVAGADSLVSTKFGNALGRFDRNLSFKSAITEVSAEVEYYPLQTFWRFEENRLRPFLGVGIGAFHFNPKANLNGQWVALQPLHLEGQGFPEYPDRKPYKLTQLYLPATLGIKYRISNNYFIGASATFRKTFTDYIDDVSTTYIDPNLFDKYLSRESASVAKQLYYRGKTSETTTPGPYRGSDKPDSYTSVFLTLTYFFDRPYFF